MNLKANIKVYNKEEVFVATKEIYGLLKAIQSRKSTDREYYLKLSRLRKYFSYLEENSFIFISPIRDFSAPKYSKRSFPVLKENEIEDMLEGRKTHCLGY